MEENPINSIRKLFRYYKSLGDKAIAQVEGDDIHWQMNDASNSIAIIVKHLHGNMLSRWTNFLTEDGEKSWRKRDEEFENTITDKQDLLEKWEAGWACLFGAIDPLQAEDADRIIYIRNQGHSVLEALHRQLGHYAYHIGQVVYIARMIRSADWQSLSIPKGQSKAYNQNKFDQDKGRTHFTDEWTK